MAGDRLPVRRALVAIAALLAIAAPTVPTGLGYAAPEPPGGNERRDPGANRPPGGEQPGGGQRPPREPAPPSTPPPAVEPPPQNMINGPLPATPPPAVRSQLPNPGTPPRPDVTYEQGTPCVTSAISGNALKTRPWAQDALQIDQVHRFVRGAGQRVAVIDTGVHPHPFFGRRLQGAGDYVSDKNGLEDCDGHGTLVAGIIAGDSNNPSIGFNGMAPEASILSIRQTSGYYEVGEDRPRKAGTMQTLAQAVAYAASQNVDAINISLTSCLSASAATLTDYRPLQAAVAYAVNQRDVVVVAAAGNLDDKECTQQNDNPNPQDLNSVPLPPWFAEDVLSVASIGDDGNPSEFSIAGPWVSVAGPGDKIISLDPAGNKLANTKAEEAGGQAVEIEGTSFAAPYVTGLVALVRQKFPDLNARQVMRRIEATAQHPAATGGRNNEVGYGMINPIGALTMEVAGEQGSVAPAQAREIPANIPPPFEKDWTPTIVALAGAGTGIVLLGITLFIVRTVQRNRRRANGGFG